MPIVDLVPDPSTLVNDANIAAAIADPLNYELRFDSGVWNFSQHFIMRPGQRIKGVGHFAAVMYPQAADACFEFGTPTTTQWYGGGIENLKFDCNYIADCPVRFGLVNKIVFDHLWITHANVDGIRFWGTQNSPARGLLISSCNGDGIDFDWGASKIDVYHFDISGCGGWNVNLNTTAGLNGGTNPCATIALVDGILENITNQPGALGALRIGGANAFWAARVVVGFGSVTHAVNLIQVDKDRVDMVTNYVIFDNIRLSGSVSCRPIQTAAGTDVWVYGTLPIVLCDPAGSVINGSCKIYGQPFGNTVGLPGRIP